jgi:hypothetical protein
MSMIRKLITAALAASLAGCATTGGVPTTSTVTTTITNDMAMIQADVKLACNYVVPIADVAAIVATFVPAVGLVGTVTTQICNAVTAMGVRRGEGLPQVNGVPIHGYFIAAMARKRHHP